MYAPHFRLSTFGFLPTRGARRARPLVRRGCQWRRSRASLTPATRHRIRLGAPPFGPRARCRRSLRATASMIVGTRAGWHAAAGVGSGVAGGRGRRNAADVDSASASSPERDGARGRACRCVWRRGRRSFSTAACRLARSSSASAAAFCERRLGPLRSFGRGAASTMAAAPSSSPAPRGVRGDDGSSAGRRDGRI